MTVKLLKNMLESLQTSKSHWKLPTVCVWILYNPVKSYVVKQPQEKWACDYHDDAPPLSFQLQVTEVIF